MPITFSRLAPVTNESGATPTVDVPTGTQALVVFRTGWFDSGIADGVTINGVTIPQLAPVSNPGVFADCSVFFLAGATVPTGAGLAVLPEYAFPGEDVDQRLEIIAITGGLDTATPRDTPVAYAYDGAVPVIVDVATRVDDLVLVAQSCSFEPTVARIALGDTVVLNESRNSTSSSLRKQLGYVVGAGATAGVGWRLPVPTDLDYVAGIALNVRAALPGQVLRPDATEAAGGWDNVGGAATLHAATADESDTTLVRSPLGTNNALDELRLSVDPGSAFGAGDVFIRIRARRST